MDYTRVKLGYELKQLVQESMPQHKIGDWAYKNAVDNSLNSLVNDAALDIAVMENGEQFAVSYEELEILADALMLGQPIHWSDSRGRVVVDAWEEDVKYQVKEKEQVIIDENFSVLKVNNVRRLQHAFKKGYEFNTKNPQGWNALHFACQKGDMDAVRYLVAQGVNINAQTNKGETALYIAIWNRYLSIACFLIAQGADVYLMNEAGWTPLHMACCIGSMIMVSFLMHCGLDLQTETRCGWSAWYIAFLNQQLPLMQFLIEVIEVNINALHSRGMNALHMACEENYFHIVKQLVDYNADIHCRTSKGDTPYLIAVAQDESAMMLYFLKQGANFHDMNFKGQTALHQACQNKATSVIFYLMSHGAEVDLEKKDAEGNTPVDMVRKKNYFETWELWAFNKTEGLPSEQVESYHIILNCMIT